MSPSIPNLQTKLQAIFPRTKVTEAKAEQVMRIYVDAMVARDTAAAKQQRRREAYLLTSENVTIIHEGDDVRIMVDEATANAVADWRERLTRTHDDDGNELWSPDATPAPIEFGHPAYDLTNPLANATALDWRAAAAKRQAELDIPDSELLKLIGPVEGNAIHLANAIDNAAEKIDAAVAAHPSYVEVLEQYERLCDAKPSVWQRLKAWAYRMVGAQ